MAFCLMSGVTLRGAIYIAVNFLAIHDECADRFILFEHGQGDERFGRCLAQLRARSRKTAPAELEEAPACVCAHRGFPSLPVLPLYPAKRILCSKSLRTVKCHPVRRLVMSVRG
jgi:hypothetical protein